MRSGERDLRYGVDVALMAYEGLHRASGADVPEFGRGVARARDEEVGVGRGERDTVRSRLSLNVSV